jgi:hypothetical protein
VLLLLAGVGLGEPKLSLVLVTMRTVYIGRTMGSIGDEFLGKTLII